MATVTDDQVRRWWPVVETHARRFSNLKGSHAYLVEFDDLVQEGIIAVWLTLEKGGRITNEIITNAMRDWVRHVTHGGRVSEATV